MDAVTARCTPKCCCATGMHSSCTSSTQAFHARSMTCFWHTVITCFRRTLTHRWTRLHVGVKLTCSHKTCRVSGLEKSSMYAVREYFTDFDLLACFVPNPATLNRPTTPHLSCISRQAMTIRVPLVVLRLTCSDNSCILQNIGPALHTL